MNCAERTYPECCRIIGVIHGLASVTVFVEPAAEHTLVEEVQADQHLYEVVQYHRVPQVVRLLVPHVPRADVRAEVNVGDDDHYYGPWVRYQEHVGGPWI